MSDERDKFGFRKRERDEIVRVLSSFKEIESCVLFGSRARGSFYKASDVDLAIMGQKVDFGLVLEVSSAFRKSILPLRVNITDYNNPRNDILKACVARDGVIIYPEVISKEKSA